MKLVAISTRLVLILEIVWVIYLLSLLSVQILKHKEISPSYDSYEVINYYS
jgi:hypothetical protein